MRVSKTDNSKSTNDNETIGSPIGSPMWKISLGLVLLTLINLSFECLFNSIELYAINNFDISISPQTTYLIFFSWFYVITPALLMKVLILYGKASRAEPYK